MDRYVTLFSPERRTPDSLFDVALFQKEITALHQDLIFLYQLLQEQVVRQFNTLDQTAELHLSELEEKAARYQSYIRLKQTALTGETLFESKENLPLINENNFYYAELGRVNITPGTAIAFLVDGDGIEDTQLGIRTSDTTYYVEPYALNKTVLSVPGEIQTKQYLANTNKEIALNTSFALSAEGLMPKASSSYTGYLGKGRICINNQLHLRPTIEHTSAYTISEGVWDVSFIVKESTYISFEFSKQAERNFEGYVINKPDKDHLIEIRGTGAFTFSVQTDGTIYAEKRKLEVDRKKLICLTGSDASDVLIEEATYEDKKEAELFVRVRSDKFAYPKLKSVLVKERRL